MYWPTTGPKGLLTGPPLIGPLIALRSNRRANFFAVLTQDAIAIWNVRPSVQQVAIKRDAASLERWGENVDVFWAHDGRGVIVLTSTSHLLVYQLVPTHKPIYELPTALSRIHPGAGEGDVLMGWTLKPLGAAFVMGGCTSISGQSHSISITLRHPPSILTVPYPIPTQLLSPPNSNFPPAPLDGDGPEQSDCEHWDLERGKDWLQYQGNSPPVPTSFTSSRIQGLPGQSIMTTDDGRVYVMYTTTSISQLNPSSPGTPTTPSSRISPHRLPPHQANTSNYFSQSFSLSKYTGHLVHPLPVPAASDPADGMAALGLGAEQTSLKETDKVPEGKKAVHCSMNGRLGLLAIGTDSEAVELVMVPPYPQKPRAGYTLSLRSSAGIRRDPGVVKSLAWTSDGYALAVAYESAWAVWSVGGRLGGWGFVDPDEDDGSAESFMRGSLDVFWAPGNLELFILGKYQVKQTQLYAIPFAKSATTGQHSPDNTRYAFLQMDDKVMVYRGADQPDMSVINPESDVWQPIKIPNAYISTNWPIKYASISSDGKLIAVAGRRGLTHYSAASGRWKLFEDEMHERSFVVRGGLLWFHHVLVAGIEVDKAYSVRLYSRDADLTDKSVLSSQSLPSPILVMSLLDNSLLVYTADNTLYHFLILPSKDTVRLHLCGSISFMGIVQVPSRVRALSWLIPQAQKERGDPADDLIVATIIFLVDGRLELLRPRRAATDEVRYDLQVLADGIESYWTHLQGVGTLENSLWGYDGKRLRVWLDALTIEETKVDSAKDAYETVQESVSLSLDFYPLSILMDKGIIIGVDYETSTRSLPFSLFKIQTGTHLFLPQFLRYHLSRNQLASALSFSRNYSSLIYFSHSLEILLHSVLEDESASGVDILPGVVDFLDHFDQSLDVVVGVARKVEVQQWELLFKIVGRPRELFEQCLKEGSNKTAAGYLLVLQNLEELDDVRDTVRVLRAALKAKEYELCKEVVRFLHSIDPSGLSLKTALEEVGLVPSAAAAASTNDTTLTGSINAIVPNAGIPNLGGRVLPEQSNSSSAVKPRSTSRPRPVSLPPQGLYPQRVISPLATSPSTLPPIDFPSPDKSRSTAQADVPAPNAQTLRPPVSSHPSHSSQNSRDSQLSNTSHTSLTSRNTPSPVNRPALRTHLSSSSPGSSSSRVTTLRDTGSGRINSPFELVYDRQWKTPPSPRTIERMPEQPLVPSALGFEDVDRIDGESQTVEPAERVV